MNQHIDKIVNRYAEMLESVNYHFPFTKDYIRRTLIAADMDQPLRLDELAEADEFNLMHDVSGILNHYDPSTGEYTECFMPRFSKCQ